MFVISPDDKLKKEIDGVTFECAPPVGEIEIRVMRCLDSATMSKARELADKDIAKSGKKKTVTDEQYSELVRAKLASIRAEDQYDSLRRMDAAVDVFLRGWSGTEVPEFPKDGNPSRFLPVIIKQKLFVWYQDQFHVPKEDQKN
jgi:hypothetical protein